MKVREVSKRANTKRRVTQVARQDAEIADLKAQLAAALKRIDNLEKENAQLKRELAAARKDSSTSSKPPSSDIVNPKKAAKNKRKRKRKPGGQKGHPKHERPDFPPESINETWE